MEKREIKIPGKLEIKIEILIAIGGNIIKSEHLFFTEQMVEQLLKLRSDYEKHEKRIMKSIHENLQRQEAYWHKKGREEVEKNGRTAKTKK